MALIQALERQKEIYLNGMSGKKTGVPFNAEKLRDAARKKMTERAWAYIDGGAGEEESITKNTSVFSNVAIMPRMMRNIESADFSLSLFGMDMPFPLLIAPIGVLDLICRDSDRVVARACRDTGVPFIFSNQAGTPMEICAEDMGDSPKLFQLYWSKSDDLVLSFVQRAEACGCKAIVLTADATLLGWRSRDLALSYLPFLRGMGIAQYTSDKVFMDLLEKEEARTNKNGPKPKINIKTIYNLLKLKANHPGGFWKNIFSKEPLEAVRLFINIYSNPALNWDKVAWLCNQTGLPVLIKGVLRTDDALRAKECGADGIIVSNHGGRQVDGAIPPLEALVNIRKILPKPYPVLMDSGIRSGSDMFKALALGADAVLLGRPYAYGLAINRKQGVKDVIHNILNDFELTARLAGCRSLQEINEEMLRHPYDNRG